MKIALQIILIFSSFILNSCGEFLVDRNNNPQVLIYGTFGESSCFKNKLASQGGTDIWTKSTVRFDNPSGGQVDYKLYSDDACTADVQQGQSSLYWEIHGDHVMLFRQFVGEPNEQTIYQVFQLRSNSIVFDINNTGPYTTEDEANAQVDAFLANIDVRGSILPRH
jgi:hypothetical protein